MKYNIPEVEGVYKLKCIDNNKVYIGQGKNCRSRFYDHIYSLRHNIHWNKLLQQDFNNFTESHFIFEIIEQCTGKHRRLQRETYWINYYGGIESNVVYNVGDINGYNKDYCNTQRKLMKLKQSNGGYRKGRHHSLETKQKLSKSLKGRQVWNKGVPRTPELKQYLSEFNKEYWKTHINPNKGFRQYSLDLVQQLRQEYLELGVIKLVHYKHPEINEITIGNLIKWGQPNHINTYNYSNIIPENWLDTLSLQQKEKLHKLWYNYKYKGDKK